MQPILVTGAAGQLGSELCRQLGAGAVALSRGELDVTDAAAVLQTLQRQRPRAVINTAAFPDVDGAEQRVDDCFRVNATAVEHLAAACRRFDAALVQISSDYVFGGERHPPSPWRESDAPQPVGVYARSKLAGERAAAAAPRHLTIRTCGLYAGGEHAGPNFVNTMLRLARRGGPLRIVADQHCTPSFVPHVARALLFLLEAALAGEAGWGTYHVVNRGSTTWHAFALEIFRLAGLRVDVQPISAQQYGAAAPRPSYSVLDTAKYDALAGPPLPKWQAALAERLR